MQSHAANAPPTERNGSETDGRVPGDGGVSSAELLELLGDETTRYVLRTVAERPRGAREIAESLGVSRPTVYRRLNDLQEGGLVTTEFELDADGHHHKRFHATLEELNVQLDGADLATTVRTADRRTDRHDSSQSFDRHALADD